LLKKVNTIGRAYLNHGDQSQLSASTQLHNWETLMQTSYSIVV